MKPLKITVLLLLCLSVLFIDPPTKQQVSENISYTLPVKDIGFYTPKQMILNLLHKWFKNKKYCRDYRTGKACRCA